MTDSTARILVTGAAGQLGRLVVDQLLTTVPAALVSVLVRSDATAAEFAALGVRTHLGDYTRPETLSDALAGIDKVLLISSNAIGERTSQHRNVIDAARRAGVKLIAYTSVLRADTTPLALAGEHLETEQALAESGLDFVVLRNGWYTENITLSMASDLAHGAHLGCAGEGRLSTAARQDYAEAAAVVLTTDGHAGRIYELAGDSAFSLAEYAAQLAELSGKAVAYQNLPETAFKDALVGVGLPEPLAALLADADSGIAKGALFESGGQLSRLIGRPTTPWAITVGVALKAL